MELWQRLKEAKKPIVLYGMGNGADRILDILNEMGVEAQGVFASDGFVRHQNFRGFTVCSYQELRQQLGEMIVLVAFGTQRPEVLENIKKIASEQELYVPDVPVAGDTLFDERFVKKHLSLFKKVFEMLSDDFSKAVFENVIKGKLTGEPHYLYAAESDPKEAWRLLNLQSDEIYMDLGAYTGDTALEFINEAPDYERIIAVEPDRKNYKKCVENLRDYPRIEIYHGCIDEIHGEQKFLMDGGRKSAVLSKGGVAVPSYTVDEILCGRKVSYIKMDVEGMERKAILGAKESIARYRPKLLISAYHRSEDLFDLPLLINSIATGGKLYIRHFPYLPAWDTNFYFNFD